MTRLRKMMLEELERRNYSEATTRCYIRTVEDFSSRRFLKTVQAFSRLFGPEHIRECQAELFKKCKLSPGTVYDNDWQLCDSSSAKLSRKPGASPRRPIRKKGFPFLRSSAGKKSRDSSTLALTSYHRTLLMTLYATGVRRAELTHLKVSDIDSKRMVIHRGILRPGMIADVTVFDPKTMNDVATYSDPLHYSLGVKFVFLKWPGGSLGWSHHRGGPGQALSGPGYQMARTSQ